MKGNYFFTIFFLIVFVTLSFTINAQDRQGLVSGPWAGYVELRNATIWLEVTPRVRSVEIKYNSAGDDVSKGTIVKYKGELGNDFNPVKIELNGLKMNTTYHYSVVIDGKAIDPGFPTHFTTKELWQFRKPAPDFSFLTGSCAYFNEPFFDRPGKPYGGDSSIFETMAATRAAFHVWLGDNWYTREVDYSTGWGLNYRASHDRAMPVLQQFMASMPQYAIWDDHDYGPNDAGKSYILKDVSRKIFKNYWLNPSYGEEEKGIYSIISYSDVDIFLSDDRFFRSEDEMPDSLNGEPNKSKTYFGAMQMEWLKNALTFSKSTFKIIATGSQVLNPYSDFECMKHYSSEFYELMNFLSIRNINGVLFVTGDRHHSEVLKSDRLRSYPLYDITVSPFTAGISKVRGPELNNPIRIQGTLVEEQNFAKVTVKGGKNERVLTVEFIGIKGKKLGEWSVGEKELKVPVKVKSE